MSFARRMQIGGVLALVAAGLLVAGLGSILGVLGLDLPRGMDRALSSVGDALSLIRVLLVLGLAVAVARVREN